MKITNKRTNEVFNNLQDFVLDAQKRYNLCNNLIYCDMECALKEPDGEGVYLLDECGNWSYLPSEYYTYEG
jgi:hypothetical protein